MKKLIISILILILSGGFGIFIYKQMTYEKTNYQYTKFSDIPDIIKENEEVIIFIKQDGCSPCKLVEPIVNNYASVNKEVVYSVVVNKDKDYVSERDKYRIKGTPTLIYYKNGKEIHRTETSFNDEEFQKTVLKLGF